MTWVGALAMNGLAMNSLLVDRGAERRRGQPDCADWSPFRARHAYSPTSGTAVDFIPGRAEITARGPRELRREGGPRRAWGSASRGTCRRLPHSHTHKTHRRTHARGRDASREGGISTGAARAKRQRQQQAAGGASGRRGGRIRAQGWAGFSGWEPTGTGTGAREGMRASEY